MTTKYVSVPMVFDREKWAVLVCTFISFFETIREAAVMAETSDTALHTWSKNNMSDKFPYPSMTNFLKICNLMDADPKDFFKVGE